jgi:hypothetical protein
MLTMKNINKNRRRYVPFMLMDVILAQWPCSVASSEALDFIHWAMSAVTYRCNAMAIKMASKVGVFFHHCLFVCCPGSCWDNTEQLVA